MRVNVEEEEVEGEMNKMAESSERKKGVEMRLKQAKHQAGGE